MGGYSRNWTLLDVNMSNQFYLRKYYIDIQQQENFKNLQFFHATIFLKQAVISKVVAKLTPPKPI